MPSASTAPVRRILVTGVGGAPGFDLARRLMELGCEVIGTDADPLATGLRLPGLTPVVCPPVDTKSQAARIRSTTYQVDRPGWRYHLSALHAAIGTVQLERFGTIETIRRSLWRTYARELATLDDVTMIDVDIDNTVPFNVVVRIPQRDTVFDLMRDHGVGVGVHYPPNHTQPAFARWYRPLPVTEQTAAQIMSLPFHPAMTEHDIHCVTSALRQALTHIHGA